MRALAEAILTLRRSKGQEDSLSGMLRIGNVDWSYDSPHWFGILLQQGDKIITSNEISFKIYCISFRR